MASFSLPVPKSNKWVGGMGELRYDGWLGMVELRLVEICLRLKCCNHQDLEVQRATWKIQQPKKCTGSRFFCFFVGWKSCTLPPAINVQFYLKGSYDVKHATKCNTFCGASSQCRHWCRSHCISLWPEDLSQKGDISRGVPWYFHAMSLQDMVCCHPFYFPASFLLWGYRDPILTTHPHNWYSVDMDPPGNKHIPWKVNLKMIFLFKMWDM